MSDQSVVMLWCASLFTYFSTYSMRVNAESMKCLKLNIHWLVLICHDVNVLCSCVCPSVEVTAGWMLGAVHWLWCNSCHGDDFTVMATQKMLVFPIQ